MRTIDSLFPIVTILLATLGPPRVAFAQSESGAIAEGLFREGRVLLDQGKVDQACDKFEASERLAPAVGTKLNLAVCRERQGRTATAWSLFAEVESLALRAGDERRATIAHQRGAALVGQLKKVVIEVPTPPPGMVLKLDGVALPPGALGTEIPLDPGSHDLVVSAPGKKTWEQATLSLGPSATTVHVRVELEDEAPPATAAAAPPAPSPPAADLAASSSPAQMSSPSPSSSADQSPTDTKRYVGYGVGGVGIVALGFATYYGITALSRKNDEANYPVGSPDRLTVYNQASGAQTAELVVGAVGLACIGAGLYLILSSHGASAHAAATSRIDIVPSAGPRAGGLLLSGTF